MAEHRSVLIRLADAVTADLNDDTYDSTFGEYDFVARRRYRPRIVLSDGTQGFIVTVAPLAFTKLPDSRKGFRGDYTLSVGVQAKLQGNDDDEGNTQIADRALRLLEEIAEFYETRRVTSPDAVLIGSEIVTFSPDRWEEHNQYTGVANLTLRVYP